MCGEEKDSRSYQESFKVTSDSSLGLCGSGIPAEQIGIRFTGWVMGLLLAGGLINADIGALLFLGIWTTEQWEVGIYIFQSFSE